MSSSGQTRRESRPRSGAGDRIHIPATATMEQLPPEPLSLHQRSSIVEARARPRSAAAREGEKHASAEEGTSSGSIERRLSNITAAQSALRQELEGYVNEMRDRLDENGEPLVDFGSEHDFESRVQEQEAPWKHYLSKTELENDNADAVAAEEELKAKIREGMNRISELDRVLSAATLRADVAASGTTEILAEDSGASALPATRPGSSGVQRRSRRLRQGHADADAAAGSACSRRIGPTTRHRDRASEHSDETSLTSSRNRGGDESRAGGSHVGGRRGRRERDATFLTEGSREALSSADTTLSSMRSNTQSDSCEAFPKGRAGSQRGDRASRSSSGRSSRIAAALAWKEGQPKCGGSRGNNGPGDTGASTDFVARNIALSANAGRKLTLEEERRVAEIVGFSGEEGEPPQPTNAGEGELLEEQGSMPWAGTGYAPTAERVFALDDIEHRLASLFPSGIDKERTRGLSGFSGSDAFGGGSCSSALLSSVLLRGVAPPNEDDSGDADDARNNFRPKRANVLREGREARAQRMRVRAIDEALSALQSAPLPLSRGQGAWLPDGASSLVGSETDVVDEDMSSLVPDAISEGQLRATVEDARRELSQIAEQRRRRDRRDGEGETQEAQEPDLLSAASFLAPPDAINSLLAAMGLRDGAPLTTFCDRKAANWGEIDELVEGDAPDADDRRAPVLKHDGPLAGAEDADSEAERCEQRRRHRSSRPWRDNGVEERRRRRTVALDEGLNKTRSRRRKGNSSAAEANESTLVHRRKRKGGLSRRKRECEVSEV